jgi:hypothetical protein
VLGHKAARAADAALRAARVAASRSSADDFAAPPPAADASRFISSNSEELIVSADALPERRDESMIKYPRAEIWNSPRASPTQARLPTRFPSCRERDIFCAAAYFSFH